MRPRTGCRRLTIGRVTDALGDIFSGDGAANGIVAAWVADTERLLALGEAVSTGITAAVGAEGSGQSVPALAGTIGLDRRETTRRCSALVWHGILERAGRRVRLAPDLQTLTAADAVQDLKDVLRTQRAKLAAITDSAGTMRPYTTLSEADQLAVARNAGAITPSLLTAAAQVLDGIEPLRAAWSRPARHVELGCGSGCQLLSPLLVHRGLTAVGVELSAAVAVEAQRRAEVLGVADRVEIRAGDAADLPEIDRFDTGYWSQPFFTTPTRRRALAAAWRALRPGGVLVAPVLVEPPATQTLTSVRAWSVEAIVFAAWAIPILSPRALCDEIHTAGFVDGVVVEAPAMATRPASVLGVRHYVVARKPPVSGGGLSAAVDATPADRVAAPALDTYVAARTRLTGWIAAAEALAVVDTALSSGVLAAIIAAGTTTGAADRAAIDADWVGRIGDSLVAHGILDAAGPQYRLTPNFDALALGPARDALHAVLGPLMTRLQTL